jgi:hypothetical protein
MKIGGGILGLVGVVLSFTPLAPIGWAFTVVGTAANLLSGIFFKSKDKKRSEAVKKISDSLSSQLNSQKETTLQKAEKNFKKACDEVMTNIDNYFEELIEGLLAIAKQLETAEKKLDETANYLNRAYAKRMLDWCCEQHEPLTDEGINRIISKVKRDFGRSMSIQTKSELKLRKSLDDIKKVLQEDVSILPVKF